MTTTRRLITILLMAASALMLSVAPASARAPKSCLRALDRAESLATLMKRNVDFENDFLNALKDNSEVNDVDPVAFVQQLTADVTTLGDNIRSIVSATRNAVDEYIKAATACRKH